MAIGVTGGANNYVYTTLTGVPSAQGITLAVRFRYNAPQANSSLLISLVDGLTGYTSLFVGPSADVLLFANNGSGDLVGPTLRRGFTHHAAVTIDGSGNVVLYLDGRRVGTDTGASGFTPAFGLLCANDVTNLDGVVQDAMIWNRVLTHDEIFKQAQSRKPVSRRDLANWHPLNQTSRNPGGANTPLLDWPTVGSSWTPATTNVVYGKNLRAGKIPQKGISYSAPSGPALEIYGFQSSAFQFGQYVGGGGLAGIDGELDQNIGNITLSATGQVVIRGSGAGNVIGAVTSSATGKVEIRGVGANNTIGAVTLSATGDVDIAGSANITVGAITSSATGTVLIKGVGANNTIGDVTLAGTGVVGSSLSGELDQNIGNITLAATGQVLVQGVASNSIGNITLSATGQVEVHGVASVTVGAITSSATGKVNIAGTTNATIGNITVAAVGGVRNVGVLNTTIGDITSSATGTVLLEGELSKTIGDITVSATGVIGTLVVGQLNTSIGIFTLQATGGVSNTVRTIGASIQAGSLGGGLQKRAYSKSRYRQENMKWPSRG